MVFAFLFGLSMDYEVFILARTREEIGRHRLNERRGDGGSRRHGPAGVCFPHVALGTNLGLTRVGDGHRPATVGILKLTKAP